MEDNVIFDELKDDAMMSELTGDKIPSDAEDDDVSPILKMITQKTPSIKNTPWENDEFNINVMLSNRKKEENRKMSVGMHDLIIGDEEEDEHEEGAVARTQCTVNMH